MTDTISIIIKVWGFAGIPSLYLLMGFLVKKIKASTRQVEILQQAQKAQMRSQLLRQYYEYKAMPQVASDDIDDWVNQYNAYHELVGANGVLDKRKDELLTFKTYIRK